MSVQRKKSLEEISVGKGEHQILMINEKYNASNVHTRNFMQQIHEHQKVIEKMENHSQS
jgi:predicted metal-dependent phosphoesterase TrpH